MKIVVFDLDETLGYFSELSILWDCFDNYIKNETKYNKLSKQDFFYLLDIFPEFLRPNIINILKYLKEQKIKNKCNHIMIYTNNQGEKEWINNIKYYFEEKINYHLFDKIISAFKINGVHIELCRTTHNKCMKDFIKCTKLAPNAELCFIDDVFHPNMVADNVYYIHINPYTHDLLYTEMINRVIKSNYFNKYIKNNDDFYTKMLELYKEYNYIEIEKSKQEYEIDKILGKKILNHIKIFFKENNNKTHKIHKKIKQYKNKTLKINN